MSFSLAISRTRQLSISSILPRACGCRQFSSLHKPYLFIPGNPKGPATFQPKNVHSAHSKRRFSLNFSFTLPLVIRGLRYRKGLWDLRRSTGDEFDEAGFIEGITAATQMVFNKLADGDVDGLEGVLTERGWLKCQELSTTPDLFNEYRLRREDVVVIWLDNMQIKNNIAVKGHIGCLNLENRERTFNETPKYVVRLILCTNSDHQGDWLIDDVDIIHANLM